MITHGRRAIDAVYHRLMAAVAAPETVTYTSNCTTHPTDTATPSTICLWCLLHTPTPYPYLDTFIAAAIFEQAHIPETGAANSIDIESKLTRSSQRKAVEVALGPLWYMHVPAAYRLAAMTPAEVTTLASQIPATIKPSHAAHRLALEAAREVLDVPNALKTHNRAAALAKSCAKIIEAGTLPVVLTPPRAGLKPSDIRADTTRRLATAPASTSKPAVVTISPRDFLSDTPAVDPLTQLDVIAALPLGKAVTAMKQYTCAQRSATQILRQSRQRQQQRAG